MLRILTRSLRRRAGLLLALGYLACVIATPAAAAFAGGCPGDDHNHHQQHVAATVDIHADGSAHDQEPQASDHKQANSDGKTVPGHCCGVTCLNAIADQPSVPGGVTTFTSIGLPALEAVRSGLGPYRLDRPPDVLLSI